MAIVFAVALTILIVYLLVVPHYSETGLIPLDDDSVRNLLDQKERCVQLLHDLDLDYSVKKLTESEYDKMRGGLMNDLSRIMAALDAR